MNISKGLNISYINQEAFEGGYDLDTVEEIKKEATSNISTMNTLIILNDFKILARDFDVINDISALDYKLL
jgi:hypothetical protein